MRHWTLKRIRERAEAIVSRAEAIDEMIWHFGKYGAVDAEHEAMYIRDLKSRTSSLRNDIKAFNALNFEEILGDIER